MYTHARTHSHHSPTSTEPREYHQPPPFLLGLLAFSLPEWSLLASTSDTAWEHVPPFHPVPHRHMRGVPFRKYTLYIQSPAREMVSSVRWPWGLKPNCRGGLGTGRWTPHRGRTHTSKQCAADKSHLSATSTAPQRCSLRRNHRLTCQGHSPREAELPPTIRVRAPGGARPQSAESRDPVSSGQRVSPATLSVTPCNLSQLSPHPLASQ